MLLYWYEVKDPYSRVLASGDASTRVLSLFRERKTAITIGKIFPQVRVKTGIKFVLFPCFSRGTRKLADVLAAVLPGGMGGCLGNQLFNFQRDAFFWGELEGNGLLRAFADAYTTAHTLLRVNAAAFIGVDV